MKRAMIFLSALLTLTFLLETPSDARPRRYRSSAVRPAPRYAPAHRYVPAPRVRARRHVRHVYRGGVWVAVPYPVYTETVVVSPPPPPSEPVYVAPRRRVVKERPKAPAPSVGLLLRLGGYSMMSEYRDLQGDDLNMGAIGGAIRVSLDPHWALELAADIAQGSDQQHNIKRSSNPISGSLVLNLLPYSALNLYGVAGLGLQFTEVRASDIGYKESYTRPTFHLGGGAELRLNRSLKLYSDIRWIGLGEKMSEQTSDVSLPPNFPLEGNQAVQVIAGLGVYF